MKTTRSVSQLELYSECRRVEITSRVSPSRAPYNVQVIQRISRGKKSGAAANTGQTPHTVHRVTTHKLSRRPVTAVTRQLRPFFSVTRFLLGPRRTVRDFGDINMRASDWLRGVEYDAR
ncbi:hypothetical protein BaRGS_00027706 [Batillaria attramentaria]|uniref:Uncharacterized protein n=1 Tax=Batillaria attramentaria TaxID=370345 RepID=A0ABD0K116_9CAEN